MCQFNTKIFYGDGSVLDYSPGVISRGVQAVVQDHPEVGVEIVTGHDYYILENGHWRGVDIFGLFDFLMDSGIVLFGRTVTSEEYYKIMQNVSVIKNGWLSKERRI
jgi:hypothetical protein